MNIEKIKELHKLALQGEIDFDTFSSQVLTEGLDRVYLDLDQRLHMFYGAKDFFECLLPEKCEYEIASQFSKARLLDVIRAFDTKEISVPKLISEMAAAGICLSYCFLKQKRALYIAVDGEFYLEEW